MLTIKTLEAISMRDIAHAFNEAFIDYFVPFQVDQHYLYARWRAARVNYKMSVGAFDGELLVGFLIFGIDTVDGVLTAHNAATGVIPAYRGQRLVAQMYKMALPLLKAAGVKQSTLEVITQNEKAIKAYSASGYEIRRTLLCFSGKLTVLEVNAEELKRSNSAITTTPEGFMVYPRTWESSDVALGVSAADYECWFAEDSGQMKAFVIFNKENGFIARLGFMPGEMKKYGPFLLAQIARETSEVKLNNVDDTDEELVALLIEAGLTSPINQYEMYMAF